MHFSNSICHESGPPAHLVLYQPEAAPSGADDPDAGSQKYTETKMTPAEVARCSSGAAGPSVTCFSQLKMASPREGTAGHLLADLRPTSTANEWDLNRGHQAKRARVENIIKGMTPYPDLVPDKHEETSFMREMGNVQEPWLQQKPGERSVDGKSEETRKHLKRQHKQLRQLRTKFPHMDTLSDPAGGRHGNSHPSPSDIRADSHPDVKADLRHHDQGWSKMKLENYFLSQPEGVQLMADALKYELSQAVSRSVDSIFKATPFLQTPPNPVQSPEDGVSSQLGLLVQSETEQEPISDVQTEALSLVLPKPDLERWSNFRLKRFHPRQPPVSFCHEAVHHDDQTSERFDLTNGPHLGKARTKVNSRSVRSPQTPEILDAVLLQRLDFPHAKIKADSLVTDYMLNEGLTTNHLKKAKLMFFYTRYPSSLVLKMCFHDVQFTRCITSQLIKWFSNFREFYYIQMEKFARQAVREAVRTLTVGRESELFRVLNMHYNKANDFQVPDRFLEVAEITLREFYVSISMGKDRDPSWKKAIYKLICKLDSDVPAHFKSHQSGEEPSKRC